MSTASATANPYDEIPYPSEPLPHSHPERLAAVAMLFGMQPPPADRCRVLEVGCSTGGNLIPMAERHPQSAFVGIDRSSKQIAAAGRFADALALENLELRQADLAELGDELGKFDYIIAHGIFSWVPPPVQDKLLALCRTRLSPQGVALVSYNVLPGWHARSIIREVLWRHAPPGTPPGERLARGRALLEFFSNTLGQQPAPAGKVLKQLIDLVLRQPDHYLWHEYFEEQNDPLYFHQFVERAANCGLEYLGDAALPTMFPSSFGPDVERQVTGIARDLVSAEQHVDLVRNRAFRQTLLCHREIRLSRHLTPQCLQGLYLAGQLRPGNAQPDLQTTAVESFTRPDGRSISSPSPALKAALYHLGSVWPHGVKLDELVARAAELSHPADAPAALSDKDRQDLGLNLVQCVATGMLGVTSLPDSFVTTVSQRPRIGRLARLQGEVATRVTNLRHQMVPVDESTRQLLKYLDGQHDRAALLDQLIGAVDRGEVSILVNGIPATRGRDVSDALEQSVSRSLDYLAANALLVE